MTKPYINHEYIEDTTHKAILVKAIKKAIDGGWKWEIIKSKDPLAIAPTLQNPRKDRRGWVQADFDGFMPPYIYSHDFAKALWGEKENYDSVYDSGIKGFSRQANNFFAVTKPGKEGWQYHLQQMIVSDDPIKYLGENI